MKGRGEDLFPTPLDSSLGSREDFSPSLQVHPSCR